MSKINIETILKQNKKTEINIKTTGILQDDKIKYKENNIINILDIKNETLKRKNKDYEIIIDFKNEKIINNYNNNELKLKIKVKTKKIEQNKINLEYIIIDTNDIFEYEIIWR